MVFRAVSALHGSLRTLWRFPLRSFVVALSAVVGVSGALSAVNYAYGGRARIGLELSKLGTNVLILTPQQSRSVGGRARTGAPVTTLVEADYSSLRRQISLFSRSSAFATQTFLVKAGDLAKNNCTVVGVEPDYMAIKQWALREGTGFGMSALRRGARVAVLGSTAARDLFGNTSPIGARIRINRVPFEVVGVMSERGQSLDSASEDDRVYVPLTAMNRRLANVNFYSGILFAVDRWEDMDRAARELRDVLHQRHRPIGKLPDDFQVLNQKQLVDTQLAVADQLLDLVQWIGAGTLLVSGLGVLAISWMSVRDRRHEIGIRRALGATQFDIFLQIVWESGSLGTLGCVMGFQIARLSSVFLARWADQPRVFDAGSAWLAISLALCLNVLFSAIPARSAARLDPIQALRAE